MSQGGTPVSAAPSAEPASEAAPLLHDLVRQGRSFSGRERHCCFLNMKNGSFANVSAVSGLDFPDDGRGIARVDWDADGDLDFWIANRSGPQLRFLRNTAAPQSHFLQLRLVGTSCNRDAISARVELHHTDSPSPQLRTLAAGDGFLSQSSKLVHFGLGAATDIDRVVVRWPGGDEEVFIDLEADCRYQLVQGSGLAERLNIARDVRLRPSRLVEPASSDTAHVVSAARLPMSDFAYRDFDGRTQDIRTSATRRRPLLINLWATWCKPCLQELSEWSKQSADFRQAGVDVIALSVDGLDAASPGESAKVAAETSKRLKLTFALGLATAETVTKLQLAHNHLFDAHRDLPLPISVLIDERGELIALYKGRTPFDVVARDLAKSADDRTTSTLGGRWYAVRSRISPFEFVRSLIENQLTDDAAAYVDRHKALLQNDPEFPKLLSHLGSELLAQGKAGAAEKYREALDQGAPDANHHYNLGLALQSQRRLDAAIAEYRKALALEEDHVRVHNNLAAALAAQGNLEEASQHFRRVVELDPMYADGHFNLGNALIELGQVEPAIRHFRKSIELKPGYAKAHNNLAFALHKAGRTDEARQHLEEAKRLRATGQ